MALPTTGKKNMPVTPNTLKFGKEKPMPLPTTKGLPKKGRSNMAMRNDAGNNSNVNKIYGPIAGSAKSTFTSNYIGNAVKEYSEWYNAPGNGKHMKEAGQFWGAVLKGSKYDKSGNQTNKKVKK